MIININYEVHSISDVYEEYVFMSDYRTSKSEIGICKYCGTKDKNKFKSKAHIIPEFTGNKEWFCLNECDDCNNIFSNYEYSLKNFGAFKNSHLPIKGKKRFPKYVDGHHGFTIQHREDDSLLMSAKEKGKFLEIEENRVKITSLTMPFVPLNVYKCLTKFAFSLMEKKDFIKFNSSIPWLMDKKMMTKPMIPNTMLFNPNQKPLRKPIALLLKKKISYNSPEFSLIFIWGFYIFQIFPPNNNDDEQLDYSNLRLPILPDFVTKEKDDKFGLAHFNMNSLNRIQTLEKVNFGLKRGKH